MTMMRRRADRDAMSLRDVVDRWVGDAFPDVSTLWSGGGWPSVDLRDTGQEYVVHADLPGIPPDDVEVTLDGRMLTIRGETRAEVERNESGYLLKERRAGSFIRTISLPSPVEADEVRSSFENGKLTITLPKSAQTRARKIPVTAGDGGQERGSTG